MSFYGLLVSALSILCGVCVFFFVRWMTQTDSRLEGVEDKADEHDKRILKVETVSVKREEFLRAVHELETDDTKQKNELYKLQGEIFSAKDRLKEIEKGQQK